MRLRLGHGPEAPLGRVAAIFMRFGPEWRLAILCREIEVYRHRLPENLSVVLERRDVPVGVDSKVLGRFGLGGLDRNLLILESQLLERPQATGRTRFGGAIKLKHFHPPIREQRFLLI